MVSLTLMTRGSGPTCQFIFLSLSCFSISSPLSPLSRPLCLAAMEVAMPWPLPRRAPPAALEEEPRPIRREGGAGRGIGTRTAAAREEQGRGAGAGSATLCPPRREASGARGTPAREEDSLAMRLNGPPCLASSVTQPKAREEAWSWPAQGSAARLPAVARMEGTGLRVGAQGRRSAKGGRARRKPGTRAGSQATADGEGAVLRPLRA